MESRMFGETNKQDLIPRVARVGALGCAMGLILVLSGCGFGPESDRPNAAAEEAERQQQQELHNTIIAVVPDNEVLSMVQESPAPDNQGSTRDWIERKLSDPSGQVLFPRWLVMRRGASRYEVRYTYTLINASNHLSRVGYAWNVDATLKLVSPPQTLVLNDTPAPVGRTFTQQQKQRIEDEEASLE